MKWIREGTVSSINAAEMSARVVFGGIDESVSNELPIMVPASRAQQFYIPRVGDTVLCMFSESRGYIIGSLQDSPSMAAESWGLWFDSSNHITFEDGKINITGPEVIVNGNLKVSGTVTSGGGP